MIRELCALAPDVLAVRLMLIVGALILLALLWWAQSAKDHPFDIRDVLMDQSTGKASLNALILLAMAALSSWVVVDRQNDGSDDVTTLLLGVLGIFVAGRVGAQVVATLKPQEPATTEEPVIHPPKPKVTPK